MKTVIKTIALAMLIMPVAASAKQGQSGPPIRQIDRSLQDPAGQSRLSFGIAGEKRLHYDTLSIQLSPAYSYAITDRITFCDLPWPMLQVGLKTSRAGSSVFDGLSTLALSLRAGVASTFLASAVTTQDERWFRDDYIRLLPNLGVLAKMPLSRFFWMQCDIMGQIVGDEAIQGFVYPRVGCQVTNFLYGMIGYRGGFFRFNDDYYPLSKISYLYRYSYSLDYYRSSNADKAKNQKLSFSSTMPVIIGIDMGNHFSTIVSTSIGKETGTFVPVELQFQIMW
jgi:hypothetical protein